MQITCNDLPVITGRIVFPRCGCWHADLVIDSDQDLSGVVRISDLTSDFFAIGKIARSQVQSDRLEVRIVGGAGLSKTLQPRGYRNASLFIPLVDTLRECEEELSVSISTDVTNSLLAFWQTPKQTGAEEIQALADTANVNWRILLDGSVWLGRERWARLDKEFTIVADQVTQNRVEIVSDALDQDLLPGITLVQASERRVSLVEWQIEPGDIRATVLFEKESSDTKSTDIAKQALERFVKRVTWRSRYHAYYPGRVVYQDTDGLIDVVLDTPELPGLQRVPLLSFSPGVYVKVAPGARVLISFLEGDPTKPRASLWEPTSANVEQIKIGQNATKEAVRKDDPTTNGSFAFSGAGNILTIAYTSPSGSTQTTRITFSSSSAVVVAVDPIPPSVTSIDVTGKNTGGSSKLLIEN